MDKTSSGLNAAAAYDLACRYNSLFQYNPAAVAACAAAYGAGMFQTNAPNPQNSVSSPTNSSTSSNTNGANTSTSSSPKQSIKQSIELTAKTDKVAENLFESVTENDDSLHESEDAGYPIDEDEQNNSLTTHLKELQEAEEVHKPQKRARSDSVSSLNSTTSSLTSFNENQQENDDLIQQNLISTANKAIESCFDKQLEQQEEYEDELEHEKSPNKKICSSSGQTSLGSILDSLTARCSSSSGSSNSSCSSNAAKLIKKVDDLKGKLTNAELDLFKTELINSVNQAIQDTFKKFFEKSNEPAVKSVIKTEKEPMPMALKRATPPIRPTLAPPTSFNVSNLLETSKKSSNVRVGDISKRKLSSSSKSPMEPAKSFKYSAQSLINHQHSPSFSSSSTSSSSSHKQSVVNQFYSAALSHLQNPMSVHHKSPPVNCGTSSFNMNSLVNTAPSFTGPAHFLTNPNLASSGNNAMFAHHHHPHHQHHSQHHQFLLAAAAASSSSSSSTSSNPAQSANYFNMAAAAANRLFTPYLLEHHHQQQQSSQTSLVSAPSSSKPNRPTHHAVNFPNPQAPTLFHVPGKRRRTKVTDTRLSPRNSHSLMRTGAGMNNINVKQVDMKKMGNGQSPSHSCNDNDDQENFNQDYDDHPSSKYMESNQDESMAVPNGHNMSTAHLNDEDDDSMSSCNESNAGGGQLATMPNGCYNSTSMFSNQNESTTSQSNNNDTNGIELGISSSSSNEYTGYQTATLSSLHLRKAKLMFFFTRYPSSTILRNFFPDVKFNKANTAQLVKWFSNFREFFYIQMEKYARQHLAEGIQHADELHVDVDSEIFRALNSHYNRNNQLEIPPSFCYVIEATLKEFFKAIQESKDLDPSWKKAIYKVIARMDDTIPEFFKSIKWMETLESTI